MLLCDVDKMPTGVDGLWPMLDGGTFVAYCGRLLSPGVTVKLGYVGGLRDRLDYSSLTSSLLSGTLAFSGKD